MIIENFKLANGQWAPYEIIKRKTIWTKSGIVWNNMRNRCNPDNVWNKDSPYSSCRLGQSFLKYHDFVEWHIRQIGFDLNYEIDKDILVEGNKTYSASTCILVPHGLNTFFIKHPDKNGLPFGVSFHKASGKFRATLTSFKKSKHLGLFLTKEEAYKAYMDGKSIEARIWHNQLSSGSIVIDPRVIVALEKRFML